MKKLPKVFQNDFSKPINNNKKVCYLRNEDIKEEREVVQIEKKELEDESTINEVLEEIFSGIGYSYNIPLEIITKNRAYNTSLIAKTKYNLITLDNEIIPISEITNITIKDKSK